MKKINNKGFTLVELLAVIIILAIVVGITIPAILTTTNKSKQKAFQTAADTAADWIDRQYQVAVTEINFGDNAAATLDSNFATVCGNDGSTCVNNNTTVTNAGFIVAAGLKTQNVKSIQVNINGSTGRSCVILEAQPNGDYANAGTTGADANGKNQQVKGGSC